MQKESVEGKYRYFLGVCFLRLCFLGVGLLSAGFMLSASGADFATSGADTAASSAAHAKPADSIRPSANLKPSTNLKPAIRAKQIMRGLYTDIATCGDRLVAVGDRGHIAYSDTEGASWLQAEVPVNQLLTAVFFVAPYGWSVGHDGVILATENCGTSWQVQYMVAKDLTQEPSIEGEIEDQNNQKIAPLLDIFFFNPKEGVAVGGYGLLLRTLDGGRSWQDWSRRIDNPDGLHLNVLAPDYQGRVYLGAETGLLFRTENQGASWLPLETPMTTSIYGLAHTKNGDQSTLLMVGLGGEAYSSADHAVTWKKIQTQTSTHLNAAVQWGADGLLIAAHSGLLFFWLEHSDQLEPIDIGEKAALVGLVQVKDNAFVVVGQGGIKKIPNLKPNLKLELKQGAQDAGKKY